MPNPLLATAVTSLSSKDDIMIQHIDQALQRQRQATKPRQYLGASCLGVACDRALQYEYLHTPKDDGCETDARLLRIFERGHVMETMMINWLRMAGLDLRTQQINGKPFGFSAVNGQLQGHVDGIIVNGLHDYNYPMLWENKALGNKTWQVLAKKGLVLACPAYAAQIALYQAYLNITHPALFTAINADSMAIYVEWVPFNGELAQHSSDRAVNILQACEAKEWLPRISHDSGYYQCKLCPWQQQCWKDTVSFSTSTLTPTTNAKDISDDKSHAYHQN